MKELSEKEYNPFLVSGYLDAEHFCNRKTETEAIINLNKSNINITLFALRRMGKTGLIHHVFNTLEESNTNVCIYIDILSTQNLKEFTTVLANIVYQKFPENKGIGSKFIEVIKNLRPTVSFDALSGTPELGLDFKQNHSYEKTIQEIFNFIENQNIKTIVAIDEFQQVLNYPEKNVEATLRTLIQNLHNTNFIFCGSNQQMMNEIFNNAKRPFFASCTHLKLDAIENADYKLFINKLFNINNREISEESIDFILDWTKSHTFYTQYLCNRIYATNKKSITIEDVRKTCLEILHQNEHVYFQYRALLTSPQWKLLKAFAIEETITQPHANKFISKHELGTSAMVKRSLDSLVQKEMIAVTFTESGIEYTVYDKFLMRWMQRGIVVES